VKSWERNKFEDEKGSNWGFCPIDDVRNTVMRTDYPGDNLTFRELHDRGPALGTIPDSIAMLRLDTDLYKSAKHVRGHLYPRLVEGGVLIIDDFGAYQGSRIAADECPHENNMKILLSCVDENVQMHVKPKVGRRRV